MPRWPDDVVLSFPRPRVSVNDDADWIQLVVDADWLFRHGWDTIDIAEALGLPEADALRAVGQGREARRNTSNGGDSNATAFGSSEKVIQSGSRQP